MTVNKVFLSLAETTACNSFVKKLMLDRDRNKKFYYPLLSGGIFLPIRIELIFVNSVDLIENTR